MNSLLKFVIFTTFLALVQGSPAAYKKGFGPGEQEWGFINLKKGGHMFYWLFYVQNCTANNYYEKPLVIWLQGGPGASSSGFGNFEEIGPLFTNGTERPSSWAKHVNLMFIDNPVGAGFSYVEDLKSLTTTNEEIGRDMVAFLTIFYKKFPKFEKTPLYIFSESYGGKMTVEIAKQLLAAIKSGKINSNFKGVGLGDAWISPMDSINFWAPFLYQTGMIDKKGFERVSKGAQEVERAIKNNEFTKATRLWENLENTIIFETENIDFYNILNRVKLLFSKNKSKESLLTPRFDDLELQNLMEGRVKEALSIPDYVSHNKQSRMVFKSLQEDFMKPVIHVVEELLNTTNLEVVIFTGTLDLITDTPGTVHWVDNMKWKGAARWKKSEKLPIIIHNYIEGYVKNVDNLCFYWVLRSGHMVPSDNPEVALEILRRTTKFDEL